MARAPLLSTDAKETKLPPRDTRNLAFLAALFTTAKTPKTKTNKTPQCPRTIRRREAHTLTLYTQSHGGEKEEKAPKATWTPKAL